MGLGDSWHKMMVYFGVADDEDDYAEEETLAPHDDLDQVYQEPRSNVRKLSRGRSRSAEYDDIFADDAAPRRGPQVRAVEPPRPARVEVHLVIPKSFNDAQQVADKFKDGIPVVLNLQGTDTELSKRLIDFASGLTYALDGGMQRIADKVFMLTPRDVEISAEERAQLIEKGFFNQS